MIDLKPCPFCGNDELKAVCLVPGFLNYTGKDTDYYVKCYGCGVSITPCETETEAIEAWNTHTA